ncbi:hypothetical protein FA95DRAFT_1617674 [Auriscalpium vulgare]|uniref:Uncharacterized protein n=1 Tax=Auriscalpium vulgare TaxID=40419 RepID=A0ACB8RPZ8_9AGAM|nr:hypothetical protein FA95DRAFT_1617674 [Auriscalpium vulgare]
MSVVGDTDPTHWIRRALTAVLGVPLAAEQWQDKDAQGSLGVYFHEGKDRHGNKSTRVMALTNKHVTSKDTTADYEYGGRPGAPPKFLAEQLAELSADPASDDEECTMKDKELKVDVGILEDFLKPLDSTWSDAHQRVIGWLDWAPKIANDLENRRYTRDIGDIALEEDKFVKNFKGNFVYLVHPEEIISFFYPNAANTPSFQYPTNHLFRIRVMSTPQAWQNPTSWTSKDGQTTDLTFGRFSELEAYTCDKFDHDSWEVAVFNFNRKHGNFSNYGDSGACIFNAEGKMVAILHSGMPKGMSKHVTFGTPAHYVVELIRERYPQADFDRLKFAETAA